MLHTSFGLERYLKLGIGKRLIVRLHRKSLDVERPVEVASFA
jgi:hypothetical protein